MKERRLHLLAALSSLILTGGFFYLALFSEKYGINFIVDVWAAEQDVVITEIMYNPSGADTKHEWVELKNLGSTSVTVSGGSANSSWRIFDGANHTFATSTVVGPGQYLVVAQDLVTFSADYTNFSGLIVQSSALNLVNSSTTVALRVGTNGAFWSAVTYSNSWGGDGNGKTLEKINLAGDNSKDNWRESSALGGTPGADPPASGPAPPAGVASPEPAPVRLVVEEKPAYEVGSIVINEFVSDPNEGEDEWVELYNRLPISLDLTGWRLEDGAEEETPLSSVISSHGFLVIKNPKGRLNNSGDALVLKDAKGQVINQIVYGKWDSSPNNRHAPAAYNGESAARLSQGFSGNDNNDFTVTSWPTLGTENLISNPAQSSVVKEIISVATSTPIILNELLPNASGADQDAEFIEIKNLGLERVDLKGYIIKNGISQFTVATSTRLESAGFVVFKRQQTGLVLKNSGTAKIQLFNSQKVLIDEVSYTGEVLENLSYSRLATTSTSWQWSAVPTPGRGNIMQAVNRLPLPSVSFPAAVAVEETVVFDASDSSDPDGDELLYEWQFGDKKTAAGEVVSHVYQKAKSYRVVLWLSDQQGHRVAWRGSINVSGEVSEKSASAGKIKKTGKSQGQFLKVRGTVTALPGVLGSQIFYMENEDAGYQVYSNKKYFPKLAIGDLVEVSGVLVKSGQLSRLKTKEAGDIKILSSRQPIKPAIVNIDELNDELFGLFIQVEGEAAEPKKSGFYLIDESGELAVAYKKTSGLSGRLVKEGDRVVAMGILTANKSGYRLEPRGVTDIVVLASAENQEPVSPLQNKKYLELTAGGLGSALAAWLLRSRGALIKTAMVGAIARLPWKKREENQ